VPNPSFEEIDSIPCSWTLGEFNLLLNKWFQPTYGTTDIFTTYVDTLCYASCFSTHEKANGTQTPRSGNVVGSIMTYGEGCRFGSYREYMSIRLTEKLNTSRTYYAEMFVSHGDYINIATNNIGMYFSIDSIARHTSFDCGYLNLQPQVLESSVIDDNLNWTKISGYFKVDDAMEYLTIGNLLPNHKSIVEEVRRNRIDRQAFVGFYFVDDVLVRPALIVTADTLICIGNSINLTAWGSPIYGWVKEDEPTIILETDSIFSITPDTTATYLVYGHRDTLSVTVTVPELLNNKTICEGDIINIFLNYEKTGNDWIGDSLFTITEEGTYKINRTFPGCIQTDIITVKYKPKPKLYLGEDSLICKIDTIILDVSEPSTIYQWDNKSEEPIRIVTQPGTYTIEGWLDGCYNQNSINIRLEECEAELLMPNVFTPNNDHINDLLTPISNEGIVEMDFQIFDRNGKKLFQTHNTLINWDGTHNKLDVPSGLYYWYLQYLDRNGNNGMLKGYLSLLR
jgi:gliding motility-associated-like protein